MSIVNQLAVRLSAAMAALLVRDDGQALAEYGLILGLVAIVVVAAVTLLGTNIGNTLSSVASGL